MLSRGVAAFLVAVILVGRGPSNHSVAFSPSIPKKAANVGVWLSVNGDDEKIDAVNPDVLTTTAKKPAKKSKREMIKFAGPALGIYLSSPLMSNIDNAFVGRSVGPKGLAALSPGTICTDQLLYLFSFLARATTGIVSKAYGSRYYNSDQGDTEAARDAASAPLTVAMVTGVLITLLYAVFTPQLLSAFHVSPDLRPDAASYVYWRGSAAWAALIQNCCLAVLMSTRDAVTPLKIVVLGSLLNCLGDFALCIWPWQWGCAGAAAATAVATLFSSAALVRALQKKNLWPRIRRPSRGEVKELLSFAGPMLAITLTRMGGFIVMQRAAMALGVRALAAYQMCFMMLIFFLLFGEPISQLSQTQLPALIAKQDSEAVVETIQSAFTIALYTALVVGSVAFGMVSFGSSLFTADPGVQLLARQTAPSVFAAVSSAILTISVDGALMASRDFGFMLSCGILTFIFQIFLLRNWCTSVNFVFWTFTMRLVSYGALSLSRIWLGHGRLGEVVRHPRKRTGIVDGVVQEQQPKAA